MVLVQVIEGNKKCILCDASYTTSDEFQLINSPRGEDLQTLLHNVLGVKPINGVLCRKRCKMRLKKIQKQLKVFKMAITRNVIKVDPVILLLSMIKGYLCFQI